MTRSLCLVSREYPPDTAFGGIARVTEMTAATFAARGVAVHVLSLSPSAAQTRQLANGVVVHRYPCPAAPCGGPEIDQALWAATVETAYKELDRLVGFDAVIAPDYFAESLRLQPGPGTVLAVQLHAARAVIDPSALDPKLDPSVAVAAEMELMALRTADLVIAPTPLVAARTGSLIGRDIAISPPPFDVHPYRRAAPKGPHELELVFVGRLEPNKRPELAVATAIELHRRGVDVHLTLVGRDTPLGAGGDSYRRSVLWPLIADHGLEPGIVRFVEQLDQKGVIDHLSTAHAAVCPSRFENLHTVALEALAAGLPVVSGATTGLAAYVGHDEGLALLEPDAFAERAADLLLSPWAATSGAAGAQRVSEVFDPERCADAYLELLGTRRVARRIPQAACAPTTSHPRLGVIMLAHNAVEYTRRAVHSLLRHTDVPLRLVVVDNASTDTTASFLAGVDDPRLSVVSSPVNLGVPGGRNAGLDALTGDEDYVVFVDNDIEVLSGWWVPFVDALRHDVSAGIAGEAGVRVTWSDHGRELVAEALPGERCDIAVGYCLFMHPDTIARIGRFDERLGLFWHDDDDYALRAARIGEVAVVVGSGLVLHFEHRSSSSVEGIWDDDRLPGELSVRNQQLVATKRRRLLASSRFLVLADAREVLEERSILQCWAKTFTAEDPAALVLYGPSEEPASYVASLEEAAAWAGLDLEHGPSLIAKLPPRADDELEAVLADEAYAVLGRGPAAPCFAHLARLDPDDPDGLRFLAARSWGGRLMG